MAKRSQQKKSPINQVIAAMKKNIANSMPYSTQEERTWFCDKQSAKVLIEYLVPDTQKFDDLLQTVQNAKAMKVVSLLNDPVTLTIDLDTNNLMVDGVVLKINKGEWVVGTESETDAPSNVVSITQAPGFAAKKQDNPDLLKKTDPTPQATRRNLVPEETPLERLIQAIRHDTFCFGMVYLGLAFPVILTYGLTLALVQQLFFFGIILPLFTSWIVGKIGWKTLQLFSK